MGKYYVVAFSLGMIRCRKLGVLPAPPNRYVATDTPRPHLSSLTKTYHGCH